MAPPCSTATGGECHRRRAGQSTYWISCQWLKLWLSSDTRKGPFSDDVRVDGHFGMDGGQLDGCACSHRSGGTGEPAFLPGWCINYRLPILAALPLLLHVAVAMHTVALGPEGCNCMNAGGPNFSYELRASEQ